MFLCTYEGSGGISAGGASSESRVYFSRLMICERTSEETVSGLAEGELWVSFEPPRDILKLDKGTLIDSGTTLYILTSEETVSGLAEGEL